MNHRVVVHKRGAHEIVILKTQIGAEPERRLTERRRSREALHKYFDGGVGII